MHAAWARTHSVLSTKMAVFPGQQLAAPQLQTTVPLSINPAGLELDLRMLYLQREVDSQMLSLAAWRQMDDKVKNCTL